MTGRACDFCGRWITNRSTLCPCGEGDDLDLRMTYLAGPITGMPDHNRHEFKKHADILRGEGRVVIDPTEIDPGVGSWATLMREALRRMLCCDHIAMLPGWTGSKGARIEHDLALVLGMPVTYFGERA